MHELARTNFAHPATDIFLGGILAFGFRGQVVLESKTISRLPAKPIIFNLVFDYFGSVQFVSVWGGYIPQIS